jgi:hypothetical protein
MEVLKFERLEPYLLLKNGNFLYKIPFRGGWAVLKVYYGSRGHLGRITKSISNILAGQTSYMPKTRLRIERECLQLWAEHGFRVFGTYDDVEVQAPNCPPGGYRLFEYVNAPHLVKLLPDASIPIEERFATYRRFLSEWSRRHDLAISLREPRLVHENGDFKHVMLVEDNFLWFDFEMVYNQRGSIHYHVAHEILQYLWQILRGLPGDLGERLLDETVAYYPVRERLLDPYKYFHRNPNLIHRVVREVDRRFSSRAKKPTSKYNVALRLKEKLEGL